MTEIDDKILRHLEAVRGTPAEPFWALSGRPGEIVRSDGSLVATATKHDDMAFIMLAHEHVPALIAEVRRHRSESETQERPVTCAMRWAQAKAGRVIGLHGLGSGEVRIEMGIVTGTQEGARQIVFIASGNGSGPDEAARAALAELSELLG